VRASLSQGKSARFLRGSFIAAYGNYSNFEKKDLALSGSQLNTLLV
jgi:hypothetical protein